MSERFDIGALIEERYRIDAVLGEGGFSVVYAATDLNTGREVAIKVLRPDAGEAYAAQTRSRFQRELRLVGRLRSPHTVRLYHDGELADGTLFAVFERVRGRDLAELLNEAGELPPADVVHMLRQLLESLREAHVDGLLHRDLKPENVRVFETDDDPLTVKLLDFGIARRTDEGHPQITKTGELLGTPRYMSPEQLTEKPLGPTSDIYSLGLMAMELLIGRDALGPGTWGAQLERLHAGYVFPMRALNQLDPGLVEVLHRMTARDPTDRYQSAEAVLRALDQLDLDELQTTRVRTARQRDQPEVLPATRESHRRRALPALLGAGLVLSLLAAAAWFARDDDTTTPVRLPSAVVDVPTPAGSKSASATPATDEQRSSTSTPDADVVEDGCGHPPLLRRGQVGWLIPDELLAYVPQSYDVDRKHPVVMMLHDAWEDPATLLDVSGLKPLADRDGFVLIAPRDPDAYGAWKSEPHGMPKVRTAIDAANLGFCIDPDRVYLIGNGYGGRVAMMASCEAWTAATVINAFGRDTGEYLCTDDSPKPHLMIMPTMSPHAPFHGGDSCSVRLGAHRAPKLSAAEIEALWRERNGCRGDGKVVFEEDGHTCTLYDCEAPFQSCHLQGGHGWPGAPQRLSDTANCDGPESPDIDIGPIVWRFLKDLDGER